MSFNSAGYISFPPKGVSLQWYHRFFEREDWFGAFLISIKISSISMVFSTILGTMTSFGLSRKEFFGKNMLFVLILSPIIVPVIIFGTSLFYFFSRLHLLENLYSMVLAHSLLGVPLVIVVVTATLQGFDVSIEQAARNLGANWFQTFTRIIFPVVRPGIITGAFMAFMTSFDELIITMFLSGPTLRPLTVRMWEGLRTETDNTITAVSAILVFIALVFMLAFHILSRKTGQTATANIA
jgi:putative spermidine/putrescine transport system permease protein